MNVAPWTKSEVRRLIVAAIDPVVSAAGFRFKKASEAFVRKIKGGRQELALPLVDYNPIFRFSLVLCVRLDAVEELTNKFSGSPSKYHSMTLTSMTQLEYFGPATDSQHGAWFELASETDLLKIMPDVLDLLRDRVLPFFEEYCSIEALNRGFNPVGTEHLIRADRDRRTFDASNLPYRAMAGIAVAYLAKDPRLAMLINGYRNQVTGLNDMDRTKFEELVGHLSLESTRGAGAD